MKNERFVQMTLLPGKEVTVCALNIITTMNGGKELLITNFNTNKSNMQ